MMLMENMHNTSTKNHLVTYPAHTIKPMAAYTLAGDATRTIPGGALVNVTENTGIDPGRTVVTMTAVIDGVYYARNLKSDGSQYVRLTTNQ